MISQQIEKKPIEDDIKPITSNKTLKYFTKERFMKQIERIKKASEVAQKKLDYTTAHNEEIMYAIEIVEKFLRKKQRICYGGQAINAHLPKAHKIYDPDYSIPDYDLFTPTSISDITYLVTLLKQHGFKEVYIREGMHEGTTKVYVNYVPVADITEIDSTIYRIMHKRSAIFEGIHYLDANSLRMLMHLELSRPRGEVTRWSKVFERLMIFNEFIPISSCHISTKNLQLTSDHLLTIMQYIIAKKRIFAGADLIELYDKTNKKGKEVISHTTSKKKNIVRLHLTAKKPILFYSPDATSDAQQIVSLLDNKKISIQAITIHKSDLIPYFSVIKYGKQIIVCIIEYSACHAYHTIPYAKQMLRIASLDTLITLYFSLGIIRSRLFNIGSMECMANKLVEIYIKTHTKYDNSVFPSISITCDGHQKTLPSLIREKVQRITKKKEHNTRRITVRRKKH